MCTSLPCITLLPIENGKHSKQHFFPFKYMLEATWRSITILASSDSALTFRCLKQSQNDTLQPHLELFIIVFTSTFWSSKREGGVCRDCDVTVLHYVLE